MFQSSKMHAPVGEFNTTGSRIAVLLCGSGAKDGSEIGEAISTLIALSQLDYQVSIFAPDAPQHHVVNHVNNQEVPDSRNMLHESARIARGQIKSLAELDVADFDAIVLPGGFGAAKNLCDFALKGAAATIRADVFEVLKLFYQQKKPIGALCIAPVMQAILARDLKIKNARITLGTRESSGEVITIVEAWGVVHQECLVVEACIDAQNFFVSSPAYMHDKATRAEVFASAVSMAKGIRQLLMRPL